MKKVKCPGGFFTCMDGIKSGAIDKLKGLKWDG